MGMCSTKTPYLGREHQSLAHGVQINSNCIRRRDLFHSDEEERLAVISNVRVMERQKMRTFFWV